MKQIHDFDIYHSVIRYARHSLIVIQNWYGDLKRLYSNNGNLEGDDEFYDNAIDHKCVLENMLSLSGYISNELIINPISFDEVANCIDRLNTWSLLN